MTAKIGYGQAKVPTARKKYKPAGESVEVVLVISGGIESQRGRKAADDNEGGAIGQLHTSLCALKPPACVAGFALPSIRLRIP
jgi:hypothetical protein